jgi:hypothetical protein
MDIDVVLDLAMVAVPMIIVAFAFWVLGRFLACNSQFLLELERDAGTEHEPTRCRNCGVNRALKDGHGLCQLCKDEPDWWMVG